jgi:hypothetical protein
LALVAAFVVWEAITLPLLQASPGGTINPLDARFFYAPAETFAAIQAYGEAAPLWIGVYLRWDIANPILYTLIFSLGISWILLRGFDPKRRIRRLNLLPLCAGAFELIENLSIVALPAAGPSKPVVLAWLATLCTVGKVSCLAACVLLLILGTTAPIVSRLRLQW